MPLLIDACKAGGADLVIVETPGIGQGDAAVIEVADVALYVMTPEYGAASQLEKIDMLDFADAIAINKFERRGAEDALPRGPPPGGPQPRAFTDRAGGPAGLRHHRLALQRRRGDRALPAPTGRARRPGPPRRPRRPAARWTPRPRPTSRCWCPVPASRYLAEIAEAVRGYHAITAEQVAARRAVDQLDAVRARLVEVDRPTADVDGCSRRPAPPSTRTATPCSTTSARSTCPKHSGPERPTSASLAGTLVPRVALPRVPRARRAAPVPAGREPPGPLPVHRRRVPDQAGRRGPRADVRRRGRPRQDQRPLPPTSRGAAGQPPVHRLRLGHPLRLRPGRASGHLRQGRQRRACRSPRSTT